MSTETVSLHVNEIPSLNLGDNPTDCCPQFQPEWWDDQLFQMRDKKFVRATTIGILHIPINIGSVFTRTFKKIEDAGAVDRNKAIVLSRDLSAWKAEHLFSVTDDVPGQTMVSISGDFRSKVFEGPFSNAGKWCQELGEIAGIENAGEPNFFYYTTCPKCAKVYGKNYVVGFAPTGKISIELTS